VQQFTRQALKRFSMSYEEYCRERPWEAFSVSRQGFEIALTRSSKKSCDNLKSEYKILKQKLQEDLCLHYGENNKALGQDQNELVPYFGPCNDLVAPQALTLSKHY